MWFKNLRLFQLLKPLDVSYEDLEAQLGDYAFVPCATYEKSRLGWISPLGDAVPKLDTSEGEQAGDGEQGNETQSDVRAMPQPLTHIVGDFILLCAQKQDRLLPSSVVREATAERVAELEARQARKIYRKERREIQDDVFNTLLPRAFPRSSRTYAYISRSEKLLVVDAASPAKAEELINLLRNTLGTFPVAIPESKRAPSDVMTRWLADGKASDHFEIHDECELFNPLDAANVIRFKGQDLEGDEIRTHLQAGKRVRQLGVLWKNLLRCSIAEDLSIKKLRFDQVREEADSQNAGSPTEKFDQEFALMTLELQGFFRDYFKAFGGLDESEKKVLPDNRNKEDYVKV
jgi:recombination associated protein RdgC